MLKTIPSILGPFVVIAALVFLRSLKIPMEVFLFNIMFFTFCISFLLVVLNPIVKLKFIPLSIFALVALCAIPHYFFISHNFSFHYFCGHPWYVGTIIFSILIAMVKFSYVWSKGAGFFQILPTFLISPFLMVLSLFQDE